MRLKLKLERYKNRHGNSGVTAYAIGPESIIVRFTDGISYLYTYKSSGRQAVEQMKLLARQGKGLSTYISRNVKHRFEKKF